MSEILREALTFINPPEVKDEVPDPKAKKSKAPVEEKPKLFEGQDTA